MLAVYRGGPFDGHQDEIDGTVTQMHKLVDEPVNYFDYLSEGEIPAVVPMPIAVYRIGRALGPGVREFNYVTTT